MATYKAVVAARLTNSATGRSLPGSRAFSRDQRSLRSREKRRKEARLPPSRTLPYRGKLRRGTLVHQRGGYDEQKPDNLDRGEEDSSSLIPASPDIELSAGREQQEPDTDAGQSTNTEDSRRMPSPRGRGRRPSDENQHPDAEGQPVRARPGAADIDIFTAASGNEVAISA